MDITELSYSDDLNCPTGAIKKAQQDLAEIVGAKRAYISTDGSTSGVMAMLYTMSKFGKKVIVARNSHKSVYNGCRLFNLEPVIVQGEEREGMLLPPNTEEVEKIFANDSTVAGILITSPDYYGNIAPLFNYSLICKRYKKILAVDGAHGAHLAFEDDRAGYAGVYADMWVDGAHKTLPTLTQGALICANTEGLFNYLEEALSIFRTTSPSYPIMASVEYGYKFLAENREAIWTVKFMVEDLKNTLTSLKFCTTKDWTKLVLDCKPLNISPNEIVLELEKRGIFVEMFNDRYILFYLSVKTTKSDFDALKLNLVLAITAKQGVNNFTEKLPFASADRTYSYLYAVNNYNFELVPLRFAEGRMSAENIGISPPCTPVVVAGEIISKQAIALLINAKNTFGVYEGKVKVIKR